MLRGQGRAYDTAPDEIVNIVRRLIERAQLGPATDLSKERFVQSGVQFKRGAHSFRGGGFTRASDAGIQAFGHWLDAPGFVGLDEMRAAMQQADTRDRWVMEPFADICEKRSLHPVGRFETGDPGRGEAVLSNPQFTIQLLKVHNDDAMVGVQWKTHHGPKPMVEAEVIGVRMVCVNLNLWGSILGRFVMTSEDVAEIERQYSELLENAVARAPILCGLIEQADETPLDEAEALDAVVGTGLGPSDAAFAASMQDDQRPRTLWTTYNDVTRYATYALRNDPEARDDVLRQAVRLLTEPLGHLSSRGSRLREALVSIC